MNPSAYEVSSLLHTDGRFSLYRARDAELGPFLLKTSHRSAAGPALAAFARDFHIARQHTGHHVLGAHRLQVLEDGSIAQLRPDWAGSSVEELVSQRLSPGATLRLLQALLEAVDALHASGLLLRDLRPSNFLHDENLTLVKIIDCSEAAPLTESLNTYPTEATAYHAPEVTGETDWTPDRRSDFYGLGVIAYRALSGATPSVSAGSRFPPATERPLLEGVPRALSEIIAKLIAKNPGERYQSAGGLRADLGRCTHEWQTLGDISSFPLATLDLKGRLRFPTTIYGQTSARAALQEAYAAVARGRRQFIVLSGAAGAGKSALLTELQTACSGSDALVIGGKWDQFQREGALTGLALACVDFVENARTLSSEELRELRQLLNATLGSNASILVELVPELRELIRASFAESPAGSGERQNRVAFCFAELFRVMGNLRRPVVLCLEDLHWADAASRSIVAAIASSPRDSRLLTIVTHRSSGASAAQLEDFLAAASAGGSEVTHLAVVPMLREEVGQFVCDTLSSDVAVTDPLSNVLWGLSQGNPFGLREIIAYLHSQGTLIFDAKLGRWVWDLEELGPTAVPHDVADILVLRVQELPERNRRMIEAGACAGDRFEATTVALLLDETTESVTTGLSRASDIGLVSRVIPRERQRAGVPVSGAEFVFRHDRIRQAVYRGIDARQQTLYHERLGAQLLARHRQSPAVATLLEAVAHLNHVKGPRPNESLARLNLDAAVLAKRAGAHDTAAALLRTGLSHMGGGAWSANRELTFNIVLERAEAEYLADKASVADELFEEVLRHAAGDDEQLEALQRRVQVRSNAGRFADAAADGVACLKLLGVSLPARPRPSALILPLVFVLLRHRRLRAELELAKSHRVSHNARRAMDCLANLWGPAFWSDPNLTGLVVLKLLRMSLDVGNTSASSIAYACYGVFLSEVMGRRKQGQRVCRMGWVLAEQAQDPLYMWRAKFMYLAFFGHLDAPLIAGLAEFRASQRGSMSAGDYAYAGSSANLILYILPAVGMPFAEAHKEIAVLSSLARQTEQDRTIVAVEILQRWMAILEHKVEHDRSPSFSLNILGAGSSQYENERGSFYLFELSLLFFLGRWDEALVMASRLRGHKMLSGYFKAYYYFFYALCLAQAAGPSGKFPKRAFRECLRVIESLEACSAVNYRHKTLLLRALQSRATRKDGQAGPLFEAAARSARDDGFPHHAAVAWELAAEFFEQRGDPVAALRCLSNARLGYLEWGCLFKVAATDRAYHRLRPPVGQLSPAGDSNAIIPGELASVLAAARALSAETDPGELQRKLLEAVLEHTGATRGAVAVKREGELVVETDASFDAGGVLVRRTLRQPLEACTSLPQTLLAYTDRLSATVLLDSQSKRAVFARDAYLAERPGYSFACVPLIWLSKSIGVVFLETQQTSFAFTPRKIAAAELLAAQGAATLRAAWEHRERLAVLQTRMNPHFLYNALNSIAEMTVTQPEAAETAIVRLADLYRFLTDAPGNDLIPLRDEIGFVRSYLQLEKLRYRERLHYDIVIDGDVETPLIPPLVLQPLVENAVHHGVASQPQGGGVRVSVRVTDKRVQLRVSDTGAGFEQRSRGAASGGSGIGIATTRSRLELCFGPDAEMNFSNDGGAVIDLSFPAKRSR